MVGKGEKFIRGVYFVGEGVNIDFLFEGIVSASAPLRSRQGRAAAGQCEGGNHCADHFDLGTVEGVSKTGTVLVVVLGQEEPIGGYLELASWLWRADRLACPGSGGGVLPL